MKQKSATCWRCGRILFPDANGDLPRHKIPEKQGQTLYNGPAGSQPLTGPQAPWCEDWPDS